MATHDEARNGLQRRIEQQLAIRAQVDENIRGLKATLEGFDLAIASEQNDANDTKKP